MNRRDILRTLGAAAATWPTLVRAQQPAMPVIGYLSARSASAEIAVLPAFRQGLSDIGYVEGRNVAIEYRWADGQYDRLPVLAAELVRRQVTVIFTSGGQAAAFAAKAATATIPTVFLIGIDPVKAGLVASMNRPGGIVTGISVFVGELGPKRLELLHELVPAATEIALLVNPANPSSGYLTKEVMDAAVARGVKLEIFEASTSPGIAVAFTNVARSQAKGLLVAADPFFQVYQDQLVALAAQYAIPTIYEWREFVDAGGLMSYSPMRSVALRQTGNYVGRIIRGEKPADIPVMQATRFEFVINLKTARALGLTIPTLLLTRADEVIE